MYNFEDFSCRHESQEGILNKRTKEKYPTMLTAVLEARTIEELSGYSNFQIEKNSVSQSLDSLYEDRLKLLREKYDYLEMCWGGGFDSTKMLQVSIDTGIPFDSITMYCHGTPQTIDSPYNYDLRNNFKFVQHYVEKFPEVKINFLDAEDMYSIAVETKQHNNEWALASNGRLNDINHVSCDLLVPERKTSKSAVVTGKGWHGVIYNGKYDMWSLYHHIDDINHGGARSEHADVIRFYEDPRITKKIGSSTREHFYKNKPMYKDTWATGTKWLQNNIMYPDLKGKIVHSGQDEACGGWQHHPKHAWFITDKGVTTKYNEYWKWLAWLDQNIKKELLINTESMAVGNIKPITPVIIDF